MFDEITWIITILSIVGAILNTRMKVTGFYVWIFANASWVLIDIYKGIYAQAALFLFYIFMCFYGIYFWEKKSKDV